MMNEREELLELLLAHPEIISQVLDFLRNREGHESPDP